MANTQQLKDLDQNQSFSNTFENNWTYPEFNETIGRFVTYNYWRGNIYTEIIEHN